jgi:hypothetical protein
MMIMVQKMQSTIYSTSLIESLYQYQPEEQASLNHSKADSGAVGHIKMRPTA